MLLEVTWELHGKHLAPKMHPGHNKYIKFDFLLSLYGDHFWDMFEKNMEKNNLFFLHFLRPSLVWYFIDFCSVLGVLSWGLVRVVVNLGNSDFAIHSM